MYYFKTAIRDRNQGNNNAESHGIKSIVAKDCQDIGVKQQDRNEEQSSEAGSEELTEDSDVFEEGKGYGTTTAAGFLGEEKHVRLIKECKGQERSNEEQKRKGERVQEGDSSEKNDGFYEDDQQDHAKDEEKEFKDCVIGDEFELEVRNKRYFEVTSSDSFQPLKGDELQKMSMEIQRIYESKRKAQEMCYEQ